MEEKKIDELLKNAENGNNDAQYELGKYYFDKKEYSNAVKYLKLAVTNKNIEAEIILGICYAEGKGIEKDIDKANEIFLKYANLGYARAQNALGVSYAYGEGVKKDNKEAIKWYKKAAEQGFDKAQYRLGDCYYFGYGVEQNYQKAVEWYKKAVNQGYKVAQYELGKCYYYGIGIEKDIDKAIMLWEQSANQGSNIANNELGSHYYKMGIEKVENREKIIFLEKAINYFLKGNGTSNTYVNTIKKCIIKLNSTYKSESKDSEGLYEKLFGFNNSEILTKLGKYYEFGYNVKQDLKKAFKCYIKAAQIGDSFEEYYRVIYFCVQYEDAIENSLQIAKEYAGKVNDLFKKIETTFDELFS